MADHVMHTTNHQIAAPHIIVVGGGPAGYVGAIHAADSGAHVTLIGADDIGGTCLNRGCIPSKTLISTSRLLDTLADMRRVGLRSQGAVEVDWPGVRQRISHAISTIVSGVRHLLENRNIALIPHRGRLISEDTVLLPDGAAISGDYLLLCTGSTPTRPPIAQYDSERIVTSDEALQWSTIPRSLVILGGGVVACEFAFAFAALGVQITVVEIADRPLPSEDPAVSQVIRREMRKQKIRFIGSTSVKELQVKDKLVHGLLDTGNVISSERALVAVGRTPNTSNLGLQDVGVFTDRKGAISVDESMRTNVKGVYAAGDVTGRLMLAHAASAQARLAVDNMLATRNIAPPNEAHIPRVTFTNPEVASVGYTEQGALAAGHTPTTGTFDFRGLGKAHAVDELSGFVKLVVDGDSGKLLGAHIVGAHATEIIHEAAIVMKLGGCASDLAHTIHGHPTFSEAIAEAAEDALGQALHKTARLPKTPCQTS